MNPQKNDPPGSNHFLGFAGFAGKCLVVSIVAVIGFIWVLNIALDRFETFSAKQAPHPDDASNPAYSDRDWNASSSAEELRASIAQHDNLKQEISSSDANGSSRSIAAAHDADADGLQTTPVGESNGEADPSKPPARTAERNETDDRADHATADQDQHDGMAQQTDKAHEPVKAPAHVQQKLPRGIAFIEAVMQPIDRELNHRFWGWRPNDILNVTDNVNNSQRGILEVMRRTVVQLTQRISRTGSTAAINPHLEKAMNWLMVKADRYWFPAPESKYKESLAELARYKEMLSKSKASFYIRTDNLIPLLTEYEDLLGSCDENLVKAEEDDGSAVSFFKADDYFYYARGVASAMAVILKAVHHDFSPTLESRNGSELLHHAIISCEIASQLSPVIIMNSDLDGFFANHRANMAAPISHARFYISQLIKTLST